GTAQTLPPPPRAVLSLDDAADGGTSAPTLRLGLGLLVPSHVDPDTGGDRDPSKPALAPAGFREIGDGAGALALARLCADTVAAALEPHGVFLESRAFNPFIGQPAGDVVTCSLSFTLALGLFGPAEDPGEPDEIRTPHPPAP
ncbi:MAG: hypothetical protein IJ678_00085, partial [Kiritimatiellae bacterium]|nr:hypothetical protein [Kiritimatiellia bacterium]